MPRGKQSRAITSNANSVTIEGLGGFHKALRAMEEKYPKALKDANQNLAKEIVDRSRLDAVSKGGVARKASRGMRAARQASAAVVLAGGPRYPYFYGAEFGSKQFHQFKGWRGNQWGGWEGGPGYFLHPTIRRDARALIDDYMKRLDELAAEAFPE